MRDDVTQNAERLLREAEALDYASVVAKIAGRELTPKQQEDYEAYKRSYEEATELKTSV